MSLDARITDQLPGINSRLGNANNLPPTREFLHHPSRDGMGQSYCKERPDENPTCSSFPPIAVVGMAARLPGGVNSPEELWKLLVDKGHGVCEVPSTRYTVDSFYSEEKPHSVKTRNGYFLEQDPGCFDASFFSISPREAARMDPQQRQLLEVVWECLESAGETNWRGRNIGCYVGVYGEDWLDLASKDPQHTDRYHILGTGQFALSNRLSYEYDFQGPSMTLQTGCSASLVGLHEACHALYSGDCSSAIVAGTNLIIAPTMTTTMSDNMVMSPTGVCRTFDDKADGYGRGEAVNALYIKKLDDALRDNDPIRAVIRATSTNCDGRTPSITTPGSHSQEALVRRAYAKAGIKDITKTAFFECHGTGTVAGDKAELSVISKIFDGKGVVIGAVKPNVGHGEGASGITSVIKSILALEHQTIPPNIFYETPNSNVSFEESKLKVPLEPMPWPQGRAERVSVNCFGIGGANAHAILDSASSFCGTPTTAATPKTQECCLLVVSAHTAECLRERISNVVEYAREHPSVLQELAYTLGVRRTHLAHRAFAISCSDVEIDSSTFRTGQAKLPALTLVFTGQGAQWAGMGKDLISKFDEFRDTIQALDKALGELDNPPNWSIEDELSKEGAESRITDAEFSQPLSTALQIGLVDLLSKQGINPTNIMGHSSGEIAGAYAAGAITARSAIIIAYYRGQVSKTQQGKGAMVAVGLSREDVEPYLEEGVVVACHNSPKNVTLSGDREKVGQVVQRIQTELPDTLCRQLRVSIAYHSHHMTSVGQIYETHISPHLEWNETMIPLFSSVTNTVITNPTELGAEYWRQNLESPVLFYQALQNILQGEGNGRDHVFLEVGPHSTLSGPLREGFRELGPKTEPVYISTLTRNDPDSTSQVFSTLGYAHVHGIPVDFSNINGVTRTLPDLPRYPWQHGTSHWHESRLTRAWRFRAFPHHELLGSRCVESSDLEPAWRNILDLEDVPWLRDHVLQGNTIFPGTGFIAMAGEAARQLSLRYEGYIAKNIVIKSPLLLHDSAPVELITTLKPMKLSDLADSEWFHFTVASYDQTGWTNHCQGQVRAHDGQKPSACNIEGYSRCLDPEKYYLTMERKGFHYGPHFGLLQDITVDPVKRKCSATVCEPDKRPVSRYTMHPAIMDCCIQQFPIALARGIPRCLRLLVPAAIGEIYVGASAPVMQLQARIEVNDLGNMLGDGQIMAGNQLLLSITDILGFPVDSPDELSNSGIPLASHVVWAPDIDFLSPSSLLPDVAARADCNPFAEFAGRLAHLYILQTNEKLSTVTPSTTNLCRWKGWVGEQAARIRNGDVSTYPESQGWAQMEPADRRTIMRSIRERYDLWKNGDKSLDVLFECMEHIFENCVEMMTDETVAENLLTDRERIDALYATTRLKCDWSRLLSSLAHSNPTLRVLEVGSKTGITTREVLKYLKTSDNRRFYASYTLTDTCQQMLEIAGEKFQLEEDLEFQLLDITDDPEAQGYKAGSFDLIISSNALHDSPCPATTLRHMRQLLSPNGRLLLHELSSELLFYDYIFGLSPDWQPRETGSNTNLRTWDLELRAAGFAGNEGTTFDAPPPFQTHFTMHSRVAQEKACMPSILLLTTGTRTAEAEEVAEVFRSHGHPVDWCTIRDPIPKDRCIVSLLDLESPYLYDASEIEYLALQKFLTTVENNQIIWVTRSIQIDCTDPRFGLISGFARTLRHEMSLDFVTFETDALCQLAKNAIVDVFEKLQRCRLFPEIDQEYEFVFHRGLLHVGRCHWVSPRDLLSGQTVPSKSYKLGIKSPGKLDTLCWTPDNAERPLAEHEVEIDMHYVALNFRDILVSMGLFGNPEEFGLEGSGVVRRIGSSNIDLRPGDRVAVLHPGMFRTRIVIESRFCIRIPAHNRISLKEAATMPSAYLTAIYSLDYLARLQKGESVLIHSACGGVGLAAIRVCQIMGAEIYATVGSEEKVQYLTENFNIPRSRIFNSRDASFLAGINKETNGKGIDVVLNSLSGSLLHASWECVAPFGRMVELGKRDFLGNGQLDMKPFIKNRAFFGFDLTQVRTLPDISARLLKDYTAWCDQEKVIPIHPVTLYDHTQVLEAFRYMQQGVHIGKILVQMPQDPSALAEVSTEHFSLSPDVSYLLVGGLGGLGRSVSTWMVENGARHLVYLSPSAGKRHGDFIKELEEQGCQVCCVSGNVECMQDVERAVSQCKAPLAGVLQMSATLQDRSFDCMTYAEWNSCLAPKVSGTWNLHNALRHTRLDFFVVFSSVAGTCGNPGQANYAAANTFLNSFTKYRRQLGFPASVLELGAVEDVGLMSQNSRVLQNARAASIRLLNEAELMEGLRVAISQSRVRAFQEQLSSSSCIIGLGNTKPLSEAGVRSMWTKDLKFSPYMNMECKSQSQTDTASEELRALLRKVERHPELLDDPESEAIIRRELIKQVRQRMPHTQDMDEEEIVDMHIDSLMAIEIRTWVRSNLGLEISLAEIGKAGTAGALAKSAVEHLKAKYQEKGEHNEDASR